MYIVDLATIRSGIGPGYKYKTVQYMYIGWLSSTTM